MPVFAAIPAVVWAAGAGAAVAGGIGAAVSSAQGKKARAVQREALSSQEQQALELKELEEQKLSLEEKAYAASTQGQQIETLASLQATKESLGYQKQQDMFIMPQSSRPRTGLIEWLNNFIQSLFRR